MMMMTVLNVLRGTLAVLFSFLSLFMPFSGAVSRADFEAKDPEKVLLNFEVISDVHMTTEKYRQLKLSVGLSDMACSKTPIDALVIAGDDTDGGEAEQFKSLYDVLGKFNFTDNYIIASGNHDTWCESGFEASRSNFINAYNGFTGSSIDKLYYS